MSGAEDRQSPHEIVIVRRRPGGHGDGHHGGAWKIAFADFMTALMCFFLVMWLINASDKKTITQIATYFNPLRLNDRVTSTKGIVDADAQPPSQVGSDKGKPKESPSKQKKKKGKADAATNEQASRSAQAERVLAAEMDLIRDPYGVLEQIVASQPSVSRIEPTVGESRSRMPKDLFDSQNGGAGSGRPAGTRLSADQTQQLPPSKPAPQTLQPNSLIAQPHDELTAERLQAEITVAMKRLEAPLKPTVEVTDDGKEVLVSITDGVEHGMFSVGSSRPTPVLVQVMEAVAQSLSGKGGTIVVRGHTDARPYSAGPYDNWRLSAARAQVAYHMLVRGGLPDERVQRIEGHAARRLRVPTDPLAPQNRRIEILVAKERP